MPAVPVSSVPGLACWPPSSAGLAPSAWPAGLASPEAPCPQGSENQISQTASKVIYMYQTTINSLSKINREIYRIVIEEPITPIQYKVYIYRVYIPVAINTG